jgi:hypothetical protein
VQGERRSRVGEAGSSWSWSQIDVDADADMDDDVRAIAFPDRRSAGKVVAGIPKQQS